MIENLFSKSVSSTLLYSNNIKAEDLPEFNSDFNHEIIAADTLDQDIIEYLKKMIVGSKLADKVEIKFNTDKTGNSLVRQANARCRQRLDTLNQVIHDHGQRDV